MTQPNDVLARAREAWDDITTEPADRLGQYDRERMAMWFDEFAEPLMDALERVTQEARAFSALADKWGRIAADQADRLERIAECEAACCPEDVGFDEHIRALTDKLERVTRERDGARANRGFDGMALVDAEEVIEKTSSERNAALAQVASLREALERQRNHATLVMAATYDVGMGDESADNALNECGRLGSTMLKEASAVLADTASAASARDERIRSEAYEEGATKERAGCAAIADQRRETWRADWDSPNNPRRHTAEALCRECDGIGNLIRARGESQGQP